MKIVFDGISTVTPRKLIGFEASLIPEDIADELILYLLEEDPARLKIKCQRIEDGAWRFTVGGNDEHK